VELSQREVFSFSVARKLLEGFEGTPLELDMRSVLGKIAESLQGTVSVELESLTDQFTVLSEDRARVEPEVWQKAARAINQREGLRLPQASRCRNAFSVPRPSGCPALPELAVSDFIIWPPRPARLKGFCSFQLYLS